MTDLTVKKDDFQGVVARLCGVLGEKVSLAGAARALGLTPQNIQNYKTRNALPEDKLYRFAYEKNLSIDWLLTGVGSSYSGSGIDRAAGIYEVKDPKLMLIIDTLLIDSNFKDKVFIEIEKKDGMVITYPELDASESLDLKEDSEEKAWHFLSRKREGYESDTALEMQSVNIYSLDIAINPKLEGERKPIESIIVPNSYCKEAPIGLIAQTNEMAPLILKSSIFGLNFKNKKIIDGDIYLIRLPDRGLLLRRISWNNGVFLVAEDSSIEDINVLESKIDLKSVIVGRVGWIWQNL